MVVDMTEIIYKELCYTIYGICYEMHRVMGSLCSEKQYQDVFEERLKLNKVPYEREKDLTFDFGVIKVGGNKVDFVIEGKLAVDFKAKKYITREDFRQMLRYLKAGGYKLGLVVNFGKTKVVIKRVVNSGVRI